jgi:hypothetical protein
VDNSNILLDRQKGLQWGMPMSFAEELLINSKVRTVCAEGQKCWRAKPDAEIEAVRAAATKAALALAQAENDLLRQRVLDLETAVASRESALRSAQTKANCEVACLKKQNEELQSQLHQTWNWYNNEITRAGGLPFKVGSLIAKALHPDAVPNEEVRLQAFKAFSAWKSDRDAARRR